MSWHRSRFGFPLVLLLVAFAPSARAQSLPSLPAVPALPGAPGGSPGASGGAAPAAPAGCTPTPLQSVAPSAAQLCVDRVLVTQDVDGHEQNDSVFEVTDHHATLTATVPNWWPSGGPVAGMVVTLWGHLVAGAQGPVFRVDRWIDHTHGSGPAPGGPYAQATAVDVSAGRLPEHRMVWVPTYAFLLDPQQGPSGGDGDIHVQTANACPAGGLTTENTPPLRGYVDHPALPGLTSSTDTKDQPSNHLADAPPVGVPVMILGATRYDYGMGWWELHPIRAWRFLTAAEAQQLAAECAANPVPQLNSSAPVPVPFGVPACTDGSEFGNPPGFAVCPSQCYVAKTVIDRPEQLAGPCVGIKPVVTPDQEAMSQAGAASTTASPPGDSGAGGSGSGGGSGSSGGVTPGAGGGAGSSGQRAAYRQLVRTRTLAALARSYGSLCRPLGPGRGHRGRRPYHSCLLAMARLAGGETRSARFACRTESRRKSHGVSDFGRCERAGTLLLRRLAPHRVAEG